MMDVPLLDCPQQDKRMSDYTFETGKMTPEEYQAIHNGPDFTEVNILFVCFFVFVFLCSKWYFFFFQQFIYLLEDTRN